MPCSWNSPSPSALKSKARPNSLLCHRLTNAVKLFPFHGYWLPFRASEAAPENQSGLAVPDFTLSIRALHKLKVPSKFGYKC